MFSCLGGSGLTSHVNTACIPVSHIIKTTDRWIVGHRSWLGSGICVHVPYNINTLIPTALWLPWIWRSHVASSDLDLGHFMIFFMFLWLFFCSSCGVAALIVLTEDQCHCSVLGPRAGGWGGTWTVWADGLCQVASTWMAACSRMFPCNPCNEMFLAISLNGQWF